MIGIVGIVIVVVMVFGSYMLAGGKMGIILHALPFELAMILGAAVGAFLLSNDMNVVRSTGRELPRVFRGAKWESGDYRDLLCLLFELVRLSKGDPLELERHVEAPQHSEIFGHYPKIQGDREAVGLICDTLRSAAMNYDDPHQVEEILAKRIEVFHHRGMQPSHALSTMADGLPALGIVAAVLGVIKTMASIDQPPEVLGKLIGGALVGTFLGVFLAYGFVGPIASKLKSIHEEDIAFYQLIREVLVANLHSHSAHLCIEVGRQNTPGHVRPDFTELEAALKASRAA